jgi:hypothetical protein
MMAGLDKIVFSGYYRIPCRKLPKVWNFIRPLDAVTNRNESTLADKHSYNLQEKMDPSSTR